MEEYLFAKNIPLWHHLGWKMMIIINGSSSLVEG